MLSSVKSRLTVISARLVLRSKTTGVFATCVCSTSTPGSSGWRTSAAVRPSPKKSNETAAKQDQGNMTNFTCRHLAHRICVESYLSCQGCICISSEARPATTATTAVTAKSTCAVLAPSTTATAKTAVGVLHCSRCHGREGGFYCKPRRSPEHGDRQAEDAPCRESNFPIRTFTLRVLWC